MGSDAIALINVALNALIVPVLYLQLKTEHRITKLETIVSVIRVRHKEREIA